MWNRSTLAAAIAAAAAVAAAAAWIAAPASAGPAPGAVDGRVTYAGKVEPKPAAVTVDHHACGKAAPYEDILVDKDKGLANAVVWIANAPKATPPKTSAVIDQKACVFTPHVQAVGKGSAVELRNSDPVLHNVHARLVDKRRSLFNVAMPLKGQKLTRKLKKTGLVKLQCDAGHTWMKAFVYVFEHPFFAVTGADGRFSIPGLPPGEYQVRVWHETLGEKTGKVRVPRSGAATLDLAF